MVAHFPFLYVLLLFLVLIITLFLEGGEVVVTGMGQKIGIQSVCQRSIFSPGWSLQRFLLFIH